MEALKNPWVIGGGVVTVIILFVVLGGKGGGSSDISGASLASANATNVQLASLSTQRDIAALTASAGLSANSDKISAAEYLGTLQFLNNMRTVDQQTQIEQQQVAAGVAVNTNNNLTRVQIQQIAADAGVAIAPIQAETTKAIANINAQTAQVISSNNLQAQQSIADTLAMARYVQTGAQVLTQPNGANNGSILSGVGAFLGGLFA